ncbi:serine/threonine-protein kinase [Nocardiopsis flavescens]
MTTPLLSTDPARIGPYTVLARIDSGGQGTVYLARAADGTEAAVKVLGGTWEGDSRQRERFARELDAARRVSPFCTAAVLDADMDAEPPYIASEYVPGPTLRSAVEEGGPRTGPDLDRLAIATVTALAAVHGAGVVHRDLKPGNVILGPDGPRVIDFGIARVVDATRQTTTVAGTPAYMSPEQIRGRPCGPAADVFSWASVMVYAATGHRAFPGGTTLATVDRVLGSPPDLDGVPARLRPVLERCLDKDPERRPSALEVLGALIGGGPLPGAVAATLLLERTATAVVSDTARIRAVPPEPAPPRHPLPDSGPATGTLAAVDPDGAGAPARRSTGPAAPGGGPGRTRGVPRTPPRPEGPPAPGTGGGAPPAPVRRAGRSRGRPGAGWATAGALAVLAVLGGLLLWAYAQSTPPPVEPAGTAPSSEAVVEDPSATEAPPAGPDTGGETGGWTPPAQETGPAGGGTEPDCHADPHHPDCAAVDPGGCEADPGACPEPEPGEGEDGVGDGTGTEGTEEGVGADAEAP